MAREFPRTRRVAQQIRRDLAQIIRSTLATDSRMLMVSITAVEISRDFKHGKVYITYLAPENEAVSQQAIVAELNQAAPFLRSELGRQMRIRTVPNLVFHYDESVEYGSRLTQLIDDVVAADESRHTRRSKHDDPD